MKFLRRHLFLVLALLPMVYLSFIDLEATQSNSKHQIAVALGVIFMSIYGVQRFLLLRKRLRGDSPPDS